MKKRRVYEWRVFQGQIMMPDEMRELLEDLRPELVHKLPPKRPHS
ncbi:MAG TPA: hypothetical protein VNC81_08235 [Xanthobacteraceae bacterium]|jgi:hypothetical protein|nr:hypothetical protein [Xanthobacteraceae bacterium]